MHSKQAIRYTTSMITSAIVLFASGTAMADWDGCRPQQRQQVQQIDNPSMNGIYFSSTSSQGGVCRALGFERAADGSMQQNGSAVGSVIVVDESGHITAGSEVNSATGEWISQILCINPLSNPPQADMPSLVNSPNLNNLNFSASSDQNGVCRAIGYERAAVGAFQQNGSAVGAVLNVNADGTIVSGSEVTSATGEWISQLICVNQMSSAPLPGDESVQKIENPQLDGIYFSSTSNQDGVCRAMGFGRAADGAFQQNGSAVGAVIIVDETGKITGGAQVTSASGEWISEIVCTGRGQENRQR